MISCLYDIVPLQMPALCNPGMPIVFAEWFKKALTWSTGFVCISRAVADELLTLLEAIEFPRSHEDRLLAAWGRFFWYMSFTR